MLPRLIAAILQESTPNQTRAGFFLAVFFQFVLNIPLFPLGAAWSIYNGYRIWQNSPKIA